MKHSLFFLSAFLWLQACHNKIDKITYVISNTRLEELQKKICGKQVLNNSRIIDMIDKYDAFRSEKRLNIKKSYKFIETCIGFDFAKHIPLKFVNTPLANSFRIWKSNESKTIIIDAFTPDKVFRIYLQKKKAYHLLNYALSWNKESIDDDVYMVKSAGYCLIYDPILCIYLYISKNPSYQDKIKKIEEISCFMILDKNLYPLAKMEFKGKKLIRITKMIYKYYYLDYEISYHIEKPLILNNNTTFTDMFNVICEKRCVLELLTPIIRKEDIIYPVWSINNGYYRYMPR